MADQKKVQEWLIQDYPPIKGVDMVGRAIINGQTVVYPKVVRDMVDPAISGQAYGNLSFMLFKEARTLRSGYPVYGFVKLRGNHSSDTWAKKDSNRIVLDVDSKYPVLTSPVGHWLPITEDTRFCQELVDATPDDGSKAEREIDSLRSEATKKKEEERKRRQREIHDRMEDAKSGDIDDDPESLRYYSMHRVTEWRLTERRDIQEKLLKKAKDKLLEIRRELKEIEIEHPEYADDWLDCYNEERAKAGIAPHNPGEDDFKEYEESTLDYLRSVTAEETAEETSIEKIQKEVASSRR
jgi:hypothetical protein